MSRARSLPNTMKIFHYMPKGPNVGDSLIDRATKKILQSIFPYADIFSFRSHTHASFYTRTVNLGAADGMAGIRHEHTGIFGKPDLIVIGGAPVWGSSSQMFFEAGGFQESKIPMVFLGVGTKHYRNRDSAHQRRKLFFESIAPVKNLIIAASARDEPTRLDMEKFGLRAYMTGCPVAHYIARQFRWNEDSKYFLISFRSANIPERIRVSLPFVQELERVLNAKAIIVFHAYPEVALAKKLSARASFFRKTIRPVNYVVEYNPDNLVPLYSNAKFVLAYRLHGALLSATCGTPFLHINTDGRGDDFTATFDQNNISTINGVGNNGCSADDILKRIKNIVSMRHSYSDYKEKFTQAQENLKAFKEYLKQAIHT